MNFTNSVDFTTHLTLTPEFTFFYLCPSRKPALIALSINMIGGLQKLWCANLTLLIFVVRAYENPAVSTMGGWVGHDLNRGRAVAGLVTGG